MVVLLVVAASCGSGDGDDQARSATSSTTSSTAATAMTTLATTSSTTSSSTTTPATTATPTASTTTATRPGDTPEEAFFASPSGNILCALHATYGVRSDIGTMDWSPPPKPGDCEFDWGNVVELGDDAGFACVSDTPFERLPDPLPYGSSVERERFTCQSAETGVTCRNTGTGAGFSLSRGSYELLVR